jgi:uncharacterized OB-fold protein
VSDAAAVAPDPRPRVVLDRGEYRLEGVRCRDGHPLLARFHRCPRCGAEVAPESFGPEGTVWSFTVMHVASLPEEPVPYALAYLDLADGPRVLVRIEGEAPRVGDRARLIEPSPAGDARAEVGA